jgi:hypothetical protein
VAEVTTLTPVAWRNRIVGSGEEPPEQLLANPANWRLHPKEQQRALAGALPEVGWVVQVLVNRTTGHVVDGHLRVNLAISRGAATVPVFYVASTRPKRRSCSPRWRVGLDHHRRLGDGGAQVGPEAGARVVGDGSGSVTGWACPRSGRGGARWTAAHTFRRGGYRK